MALGLGTQNLKELVGFGLSSAELIAAISDGVDFSDLVKAVEPARRAPAAFKDAELAWPEYQDMDDAEAAELEKFVQDDFDIPNDSVELAVEKALAVTIALRDLAKLLPKKAV